MYLTGPDVVKTVTHEDVTHEDLGGASVHNKKTGVCDGAFNNDIDCLQQMRSFFNYLPLSNIDGVPIVPTSDPADRVEMSLENLVPDNPNKPYNIRNLIEKIVDEGDFFEIKPDFAKNIITGFARFEGRTVGIVANQPEHLAGCLDIHASTKAARFVRYCDAFSIPLLTLIDVPGFLPGTDQEHNGIIKHGAKLLYAFAEATVPKITVVMRKAYGGAYIVMNSRHLRADYVYAWPEAEIAVMGAKSAAEIVFRKEANTKRNVEKYIMEKEQEYQKEFSNPYRAAERGYIDAVITPEETRKILIKSFSTIINKQDALPYKKHGNIPL